jgi:uncharacterized protein YfiM (DUF2279 family)
MIAETLLVTMILATAPDPESSRDRWFAEDKLRHFVTSFVVTSVSASSARAAGLDRRRGIVAGAGTGVLVGLLKEVHDTRSGGIFSTRDLLWDLGGVGGAVLLLDASR